MARTNVKRRHTDLPHFESVARISSLPIVENSMHIAGNVYDRIKRSNSLMSWSLCTAEQSIAIATASAKPAIYALNGPITTIDQLLCKGIDIVEQRVPAVHLPPHLMYCNAREYVNKKIVRPVLMRAGSVKQIGSQAANAAADRLDGALTVADKYVDRYLPADPTDKVIDEVITPQPVSKTTRTIKHGARLSRKLQRRLTRRTLAEARALKEQGTECIHVLLYVVELIVSLFSFHKDEPTNKYTIDSDVFSILCGMNLDKYSHVFQELDLKTFLKLTEDDLCRLGMDINVHRMQFQEHLHQFHRKQWSVRSIGVINRLSPYTLYDGIVSLSTVTKQVAVIGSSFQYIKNTLQRENNMKICLTNEQIADYEQELKKTRETLSILKKELLQVQALSKVIQKENDIGIPATYIGPKKHSVNWTILLSITLVIGICLSKAI